MTLYELHEGANDSIYPEDYHWLAVWADSPEQARAIYLDNLLRFTDYTEADMVGRVPFCRKAVVRPLSGCTVEPGREGSHVEGRLEVQRAIGWRCPDEGPCERCECYPLGMAEHRLCDGCNSCPACGCVCDEGGGA